MCVQMILTSKLISSKLKNKMRSKTEKYGIINYSPTESSAMTRFCLKLAQIIMQSNAINLGRHYNKKKFLLKFLQSLFYE